jgi:methionyl-tRNA synthetase
MAEEPAKTPEQPQSDVKPTISFDDFLKLDIRIAKVIEVSDHPNADKLLVLKIDLGGEQRQIIAGLKGHCSPESLLGSEIVVVVNLAPRKMRGLESNGMLLAATYGEGADMNVVCLGSHQEVPPGSRIS